MQIIDIYTTIVVLLAALFNSGLHNIFARQITESLFVDADLGVTVKIDSKGLIDCSGLLCSDQTEYCKILESPSEKENNYELRKQCMDKNDEILKQLIEVFKENIPRKTNTTIFVFKNGTNIAFNGKQPNVDSKQISEKVKEGWNIMKEEFKKAFHV